MSDRSPLDELPDEKLRPCRGCGIYAGDLYSGMCVLCAGGEDPSGDFENELEAGHARWLERTEEV